MKKLLFLFFLIFNMSFGQNYTADEIVDTYKEKLKLDGSEAVMRLVIYDNRGNMRVRKIAAVTKLYDKGETNKILMRFLEPREIKGTSFLTYNYDSSKDNDQWLYLPSLRKIRRIVSSEKGNSFMGSEFTYADIGGIKITDFNFKLSGEKMVNREACWEIEQVPINEEKEEEYDFLKKIIYISKKDFIIRRALYYNFDGEPRKEFSVLSIKEVDLEKKRYRLTHMVMKNLENERVSEMITDQIVLNRDVKDEYFSFRYLKRE
ncbi:MULTISPECIES: outer membrane lipoprotein-sorting protein [Psychrilyobacter]|uniref:Outer membrane lipoprotein-sorting protein n=1 Tax=Psychrilyobacter piezotolerans TaxID=2293438 RepID=A0ABX9KFB6_9FUSO|nr:MULTISPECIES: outer membrane lipoprotein-sorting protein [Psychrilyobacter]MCS5420910.1 outer membrane lipoprotein-sorting protein [Psychrilyobacter sp. S5]NDI78529.1 outer membrane lipoprotein-sorting protein [Psychrilyobacter piezotolerans]RDE60463.1 outer membrane lipoprotein-sorting protein [Psychrilyobacter sp. S5]REI40493.1 outer membrane lipoprotein-sorting protein [Psychrilyobacter piezotolerans]